MKPVPASSKLLQKKWRAKDYDSHVQRLKQIKSNIDLNPPTQYGHIRSKAKKDQILEGKK
jgi:hypothetical protein